AVHLVAVPRHGSADRRAGVALLRVGRPARGASRPQCGECPALSRFARMALRFLPAARRARRGLPRAAPPGRLGPLPRPPPADRRDRTGPRSRRSPRAARAGAPSPFPPAGGGRPPARALRPHPLLRARDSALRSLARLQPDLSTVLPLPAVVKLHLLASLATAAVLPFTQLPFAIAGPVAERYRRLAARPSWQVAAKRFALGAEVALAGLLAWFLMTGLRRTGSSQGYAPAQPIAFSHRIHAGTYRVPCLYCHFAAEKSRHAG